MKSNSALLKAMERNGRRRRPNAIHVAPISNSR